MKIKWIAGISTAAAIGFIAYNALVDRIIHGDRRSRINRANMSPMKGLEITINGYFTEYGHLPSALQSSQSESSPIRAEGQLLKSLTAQDSLDNPKAIKFFDYYNRRDNAPGMVIEHESIKLVDSWGEPYYVQADINKDWKIPNPDSLSKMTHISTRVLIYSSGPDKDPITWKDNIKSWD